MQLDAQTGGATAAGTGAGASVQCGAFSIAIGGGSGANAQNISVAIGDASNATGQDSVAIGRRASAATGSTGAVVVGSDAAATAAGATALGHQAQATGTGSVALGGNDSVVEGVSGKATGAANANGIRAVAIGTGAGATGMSSIAEGDGATAGDVGSIAIGANASTTVGAANALALGTNSNATAANTIAIGTGNVVSGVGSGAFGDPNIVSGAGSYAFGNNNTIAQDNTFVLGNGVTTTQGNGVVLGNASTDRAATTETGVTLGGTTYIFAGAGSAANGVVSVGAVGAERQIVNVAAGRVAADSTDAVNGSQLFATNQAVTQNSTNIANLGNTVTAISNGAGIEYFRANSTFADSQANGTNSVAIGPGSVATAAGGIAEGLNAQSIGTGSVAIGQNSVAGDVTDPTRVREVAIGNAAKASAQNTVAIGDTALANGPQGTALGSGAQAGTNATATGRLAIAGNSSVAYGVNANAGLRGTALGQGAVSSASDSTAVGSFASATGVGGLALGRRSTVTAANSVALGTASGASRGAQANYTGYALGAPQNSAGEVSIGTAGAERQITNVAAGSTATDAVNVSQLTAVDQKTDALGGNTATALGGGAGYDPATGALTGPTYHMQGGTQTNVGDALGTLDTQVTTNTGDITNLGTTTTANSSSITALQQDALQWNPALNGGAGAYDASHGSGTAQKITNVAAGNLAAGSTDAVNGDQLNTTNQQVTQNTTNISGNTTAITNLGDTLTNIAGDTSPAYVAANGVGLRYARTNETGLAPVDAFANGLGSTAVGYNATASADSALALGRDTRVTTEGGVAIGSGSVSNRAIAPATGSLPVGSTVVTYNTKDEKLLGAVSVGDTGAYRQITNVADGTNAQDAVTLRQLAGVAGSLSVSSTQYFHANSIAPDALAIGTDSVAVGPRTVVNGNNGIGVGNGAIVEAAAPGGTAIGQDAHVLSADAAALGTSSQAGGVQSLALGAGANASFAGSVALGAHSTTSVGARTGYVAYGLGAPQNSAGEVSIGSAGAERQITNVAAGSAPTDAANVGQLDQVAQNTAGSLGGGAAYDPVTGVYTAPSYAVGGTTYNTVGAALGAQNQIVGNQGNAVAAYLGGGGAYDPATGALDGGFTVNGTTYANVAAAVSNVAATAGNAVQYDDVGHSGVTLGGAGAAAPVGLHNVAAGDISVGSTDAVNGSQLNQTNQQVAQNSNDIAGNTAAINTLGGQVSQNTSDIDNLSSGLANGTVGLVQQTGGTPGNGQITIGSSTGGTSINVSGTDGDRVISGVANGVAPDDAVNVSQLAAAITNASQNAVGYDDDSHTSVTFNKGGAATGLHNVAAGNVSAGSTDAVNGSQLYQTDQQVADNTTQINAIDNGQAGAFRSNNTSSLAAPSATGDDAVAGGFGAVASGTHSTALGANSSATGANSVALGYGSTDDGRDNVVSVGAAGAERQIANVAAGTHDTDAVNVGQLNSGLADTLTRANNYTDSRLDALNYDLSKARRDADAGTAAALAAAGLPQAFTPGAGMIAGGMGVWRDEGAFALGVSKIFNDGHTIVKGGATMTTRSNTFGANVGIGYQF